MLLSVIVIIVCVLLILVILVQNSKGGGIQSQFGAATQIMGVKRGTEFIEKATWGLAIALILLSVIMSPKSGNVISPEDSKSVAKEKAQTAVAPAQRPQAQPAAPVAQPQQPAEQPK